jgi:hypothetical protein
LRNKAGVDEDDREVADRMTELTNPGYRILFQAIRTVAATFPASTSSRSLFRQQCLPQM